MVGSNGGPSIQLTKFDGDVRPQWSPGGQYLVFTSQARDGNWEIYRIDVNDLSLLRITDNPAQDVSPTVSPDGTTIAFLSDRDGAWKIWIVPIDGGEPVALTRIRGGMEQWFDHSLQWVP